MKFEDWRYNLLLVAPGKGEAKKTVSQGIIRLELFRYPATGRPVFTLDGSATDDILSIYSAIGGSSSDIVERTAIWVRPETLKTLEVTQEGFEEFSIDVTNDSSFSEEFDKIFWEEHVLDSIMGNAKGQSEMFFQLNPDRFGKLGLLRPRGIPFDFEHVEWADRSILRWYQGDKSRGVYTYGQR